jgi:hypothetical protein
MTLEDIEGIFNKAAFDGKSQFGGLDHRAGIRAVVEALRDEMRQECYNIEVDYFLKEILASDGVILPSYPPQDPAVVRAREALGEE